MMIDRQPELKGFELKGFESIRSLTTPSTQILIHLQIDSMVPETITGSPSIQDIHHFPELR